MQLFSLDPAVVDETDGLNLNRDIDLFNPVNGFRPKGSLARRGAFPPSFTP